MKKIKLCLVTEFEQENFFQWEIALGSYSEFSVSSAVMNDSILWTYPLNDSHWDQIREAEVVFVYCVRHDLNWEWYELPLLVKKIMNPKAKMICQFDLEFLWLFYPNHHFWKKEVVWIKDRTPEQFFKETRVMDVADTYIILFNSLLKKYTSKSTYYLPLPQLVRYESFLGTTPSKKELVNDKSRRVVVLKHSVKSASIKKTLKEVIIPSDFPVTIFTTRNTDSKEKLKILKVLPQPRKSVVYGNISRDDYMEFLKRGYAAIDDNEGYHGWSRFAMECALAHVPCVGSTLAVKEFFPELYTKSKDYRKQKELLEKLHNNKDFWLRMAKTGKKLVLEKMDTGHLIKELVKIIISTMEQKKQMEKTTSIKKLKLEPNTSYSLEWEEYKNFIMKWRSCHKTIPSRPLKDGLVMDNIHKRIINQKQWDFLYGQWRKFIEGKGEIVNERKSLPKPKEQSKLQPKSQKMVKPKRAGKPKPKPFIRRFEVEDRKSINVSKTLSVVVAVRNRRGRGIRAKNFFESLANQTDKDFELIIIDYGSKPKYRKEIFELCKNYGHIYYYVDAKEWYSPRALNIGINKARGNYIMQTNLDMIFRRDFIERIKERLNPNSFVWSVPTFLNKDAYKVLATMNFTSDWSKLNNKDCWWTTWHGHGYGAIQCMLKGWFVEVGGYDERFHPYGPCDLDLWERAKKDGFEMVCLEERDESKLAMYAHQWHPLSKYFRKVMCTEERWLFKQYLVLCKTERHQDYLRQRRWLHKVLTRFRHKAPLTKFNEMVAKEIVKRSDVFPILSKKFSIIIPVSRSGKILDRCLKSVEAQSPDEVRAYIDPIKLRGKRRILAVRKLLNINAKIFFQALTSDSDEDRCRSVQEQAVEKIHSMKGELNKPKRDIAMEFLKVRAYYLSKRMVKEGKSYAEVAENIKEKITISIEPKEIGDWCMGRSKPSLVDKIGLNWNIHHSGHPDCVRNVHRAILECENKWVIRVDDDDEILMDIRKVIDKFADNSVGIIHGNILFTKGKVTSTDRSKKIDIPKYVNHIKGSVIILNRDAFKEIHNNINHRPWQDHRRWYWILRAGYENVYVPILFGHVHKHETPDPIRLAEGGSINWLRIADNLDEKPLRLVV